MMEGVRQLIDRRRASLAEGSHVSSLLNRAPPLKELQSSLLMTVAPQELIERTCWAQWTLEVAGQ